MSQKNVEMEEKRKTTELKELVNQDKLQNVNNKNKIEIDIPIFDNKNSDETRLSRPKRCWLFVIFVLLNLIINMDNGTVPALIDEIVIELEVSKDIVGLFGSLQYGGNLLGSFLLLPVINKWNRKWILILCNSLNISVLLTFIFVKNVYFTSINRVVAGVVQAFIAIYFPIWVDQYGSKSSRTIMMAFQQVSSPLGVVFGYIVTYLIRQKIHWKWSFIVQAIALGATTIAFIFLPNVYFSSKLYAFRDDEHNKISISKKQNENKNELSEIHAKDIKIEFSENNKIGKADNKIEGKTKDEFIGDLTIFKIEEDESNQKDSQCKIICSNIKSLLTEKVFIFSSLSISCLLFISTIITFWVSDYLKNVLKIDPETIFILFVITCVTAPALGIVGGGIIVQKGGGYESKHSILYCLVFSCIAGGLAILSLTPVMDTIIGFGVVLWLFLFFGGALVPNMVGILLDSLTTRNLKGAGNSLNLIINASIGYLPGPYLYGIMFKSLKEKNPKLPFSLALLCSWIGVLFILLALIFRYRKFKNNEKKSEEENYKIQNEAYGEIIKGTIQDFSKKDEYQIDIEKVELQEKKFKTAKLDRYLINQLEDPNNDQEKLKKFHRSMEAGLVKKSVGKIYYDLSEIDEVYNNNLPQLIQNTDQNKEDSNSDHDKENINDNILLYNINLKPNIDKKNEAQINDSDNQLLKNLKKFNSEQPKLKKKLRE